MRIFHCPFKILDRVTQAFAKIAQLAGTEEDESDYQNDKQFRNTKFSTKHVELQFRNHQFKERSALRKLRV